MAAPIKCLGLLPRELLQHICFFLEELDDLKAVRLLNKTISSIPDHILFKSVALRLPSTSVSSLRQFMGSALTGHVKIILLDLDFISHEEPQVSRNREKKLVHFLKNLPQHLPSLTSIHLTTTDTPSHRVIVRRPGVIFIRPWDLVPSEGAISNDRSQSKLLRAILRGVSTANCRVESARMTGCSQIFDSLFVDAVIAPSWMCLKDVRIDLGRCHVGTGLHNNDAMRQDEISGHFLTRLPCLQRLHLDFRGVSSDYSTYLFQALIEIPLASDKLSILILQAAAFAHNELFRLISVLAPSLRQLELYGPKLTSADDNWPATFCQLKQIPNLQLEDILLDHMGCWRGSWIVDPRVSGPDTLLQKLRRFLLEDGTCPFPSQALHNRGPELKKAWFRCADKSLRFSHVGWIIGFGD